MNMISEFACKLSQELRGEEKLELSGGILFNSLVFGRNPLHGGVLDSTVWFQ